MTATFDPSTAPTDQRYLWTLAKALHTGHGWNEIAHAWIAEQIGYANPYLRIGTPTVTAATARAVRRLHDDVLTGRTEVQGRRSRWDDVREDVPA